MPQNRQFSASLFNKKHLQKLSARLRKVQKLIDDAARKGAAIGARTGYKDIEKDFRFDDFPQARREIDRLLRDLSTALTMNALEADSEAWGMANKKNDAMVDSMLTSAGVNVAKKLTRPWYNKNERALAAFQNRVAEGMKLSKDVWNLGQFKGELELALEMGLGRGKSAAELSRDVRSFLKYPDKLFRRVRDEKGVLRLSRAAEAFHPGQGVYRSSYKNALRLTATETNMAYRTADSKRWQQTDWVLGIRIQVSQTNHPVEDICDDLQGDYPKDFVFTGWHPFCKCFATSILPSPEEFMDYLNASDEERKDWKFDGEVKDVPDSFKGWVQDNEERIANAKSLPYFMKDNPKYFDSSKATEFSKSTAAESVMSNEKMEKIHMDALDMLQKHGNERIAKLIGLYEDDVMLDESAEVRSARLFPVENWLNTMRKADARHAARTADEIRRIQDLADIHTYGKDYVDNVHEIEKALNMKRGKRMNHKDANTGSVNPNFGKTGYGTNCSTCSGVYVLRRMGFNVEALPNTSKNPLVEALSKGLTTWEKWKNGLTKYDCTEAWMRAKGYKLMNKKRYMEFLDEKAKKPGIYEFNVGYKNGGGHSTLLRRNNDGTIERIEQQVIGSWTTLDNLLNKLSGSPNILRGIIRVDNALFNTAYSAIVKVK